MGYVFKKYPFLVIYDINLKAILKLYTKSYKVITKTKKPEET